MSVNKFNIGDMVRFTKQRLLTSGSGVDGYIVDRNVCAIIVENHEGMKPYYNKSRRCLSRRYKVYVPSLNQSFHVFDSAVSPTFELAVK
jgi:hypothetical protein